MRLLRFGLTCTAATCAAGAAMAALTDCETSSNNNAGVDSSAAPFDGYVPPTPTSTTPIPVPDSGPDVIDAAPGCAPANMAGFVPPAYVPANPQTFDCPNHEGKFLTEVCFGDASTVAACAAFPDAGVPDGSTVPDSCNTCLRTNEVVDGGGYGPFIRGVVTAPNVAGCVEIADKTDAGFSCAVAIQAAAVCVDKACRPSCPVTNEASRALYIACTKAAAAGTCSTFALAALACTNAAIDAGDTAQQFCFSSADPVVQFEKIGAYFCTS